jgi:hypothetical protein
VCIISGEAYAAEAAVVVDEVVMIFSYFVLNGATLARRRSFSNEMAPISLGREAWTDLPMLFYLI